MVFALGESPRVAGSGKGAPVSPKFASPHASRGLLASGPEKRPGEDLLSLSEAHKALKLHMSEMEEALERAMSASERMRSAGAASSKGLRLCGLPPQLPQPRCAFREAPEKSWTPRMGSADGVTSSRSPSHKLERSRSIPLLRRGGSSDLTEMCPEAAGWESVQVRSFTADPAATPRFSGPGYLEHFLGHTLHDEHGAGMALRPESTLRSCWDCCTSLVLFVDVFVIPFSVAWDKTSDLHFYSRFSAIWWLFDLLLSFFTGYDTGFDTEMRLPYVAVHYLRTWFVLDAVTVLSDWVNVVLLFSQESSSSHVKGALQVARASRVIRIVCLLRLVNGTRRLHRIASRYMSQDAQRIWDISARIVAVVWINHVLCCLWFALGRHVQSDTGNSWIDRYEAESVGYQYLTSLHWSLTQMTPGSMTVEPTNSWERLFNIACLIGGMVVFSVIISSLSAELVQLKSAKRAKRAKVHAVSLYMEEKRIRKGTVLAVKEEVLQTSGRKQKAPLLDDVIGEGSLAPETYLQLKLELVDPYVAKQLFFRLVYQQNRDVFFALVMNCFGFASFSASDRIFSPRTMMPVASVITKGKVSYRLDDSQRLVRAKHWLCWATLWTEWYSVGRATAHVCTETITIDAAAFAQVCSLDAEVHHVAREYAISYHKRILNLGKLLEEPPTDVTVIAHDVVVQSMAPEAKVAAGLEVVRKFVGPGGVINGQVSKASIYILEERVRTGEVTVVESHDGLLPFTSLVSVRVTNADEMLLVRLGRWEGGTIAKDLCFPSVTLEGSELPCDGFSELMDGELLPFSHRLTMRRVTTSMDKRSSGCLSVTSRVTSVRCVYAGSGGECLSMFGDLNAAPPAKTCSPSKTHAMISKAHESIFLPMHATESSADGDFVHAWVAKGVLAQLAQPHFYAKVMQAVELVLLPVAATMYGEFMSSSPSASVEGSSSVGNIWDSGLDLSPSSTICAVHDPRMHIPRTSIRPLADAPSMMRLVWQSVFESAGTSSESLEMAAGAK